MKSSILIARIMRVIETDGQIGDGPGLADAFADAVKAVNARLEAVQAAEAAKQVSDAVRLMEDSPRLLDEINALDFNRLPDWEALCDREGWQKPMPFDRTLLEKVLMLSESKEVSEPFLKMYRKATLTNNNALAVRALRRLVEVDHSQDWETNLIRAEVPLQRQLYEQFVAATAAQDDEERDRIAHEVLDTPWRSVPTGRAYMDIKTYRDEKEAQRREAEGRENLTLLRRCRDENWNRALAFSMIQAIDTLVEGGWRMPGCEQELVDACRRRVAQEMEEEDRERRWKACCETLHGAIQREDTAAIREALSAPDFLDREPSEDLLRDAQRVIQHEEEERRRKMTRIAVCSLAALAAVLALSGWWLKQKLFNVRCEGEVSKLAALAKGAHAIDRIGEALRKLKTDDPEVHADPRVNVYEGKLKTMIAENLSRTNELTEILASLAVFRDAQWTNASDSVTGHFARVESLLTGDDADCRARFLKLKVSYGDHLAAVDAARRDKGTKRHETLTARMRDLAMQMEQAIGTELQDKALSVCKTDIAEWRGDYGTILPELDGQLTETEKGLAEAEQKQKNVRAALDKLRAAQTAPEILETRQSLIEFYSSFPVIKHLAPNPVDAATARDVLDGTSAEQKAFASDMNVGIAPDKFRAFLEESVASLAEIPSFYSLYGIMVSGDRMDKFFAVSKGRPDFKRPSYADAIQISGELLDFTNGKMTDKIEKRAHEVRIYMLESMDEMRSCVEIGARSNLSIGQFENEVLKLVDSHLKAVSKEDGKKTNSYLDSERRFDSWNTLSRGRYTAYRRIKMLDIYFRWLKDELKLMPPDSDLVRWAEKAETLAMDIHVDGIPDDLSWVCLWDGRVRRRNLDCIGLLEKIPADWVARYREWRTARNTLREVSGWKIETAGQLLFDPRNPYQQKNANVIIPIVKKSIALDYPLYVLRKEADGRLKMHKALVPMKGQWARTTGTELMTGEPLYRVTKDGKPIDAAAEIGAIIKNIPERIVRTFSAKIPFFDVEVKK